MPDTGHHRPTRANLIGLQKMYRTYKPVKIKDFGKGSPSMRETFTIPAGTRVKPCDDGTGEYFVDDLSSVPEFSRHDATYYGIRVTADQVTDRDQPWRLREAVAALDLAIKAEFVPWSKSRNARPNPKLSDRSLNWKITVQHKGHDVLTTDYQAGIGHCPSHNQRDSHRPTVDFVAEIEFETENGKPYRKRLVKDAAILPDTADVFYSLAMDADAIDHPNFESWASDFGYDTDSRKAEAIYRACLGIALKLRVALGENGLKRLRDACEDY